MMARCKHRERYLVPDVVLPVELCPVSDGFLRARAFEVLSSSRRLPGRTRTENGEKSVPKFGIKSLNTMKMINQTKRRATFKYLTE